MAKRRYQKVTQGIAHINATFNNTKICISDLQGNVLYFKSAGDLDLKVLVKEPPMVRN